MANGKPVSRILYIDQSIDSRKAERVLKSNYVEYTACASSGQRTTPPTLVTSEGEFPGVDNISWYAKHFADGKWERDLDS